MKVLLVAATHFEMEGILMALEEIQEVNPGIQPEFLVTGPGIFNTAAVLSRHLAGQRYDLMVNIGIAGSYKAEFGLGDLVLVNRDYFADFGAEDGPGFLSAFDIGLVQPDQFPYTRGWLVNEPGPVLPASAGLPTGKGITVQTAHGNTASIRKITERLHPDLESMEGAAFLHIGLSEKIPCLQIRAVSNKVERRNRKNWNIPLALGNLSDYIIRFLKEVRTNSCQN